MELVNDLTFQRGSICCLTLCSCASMLIYLLGVSCECQLRSLGYCVITNTVNVNEDFLVLWDTICEDDWPYTEKEPSGKVGTEAPALPILYSLL